MMDRSLHHIDSMIESLEADLGITPSQVDAKAYFKINPDVTLKKEKCKECNYVLALPIDTKCPLCSCPLAGAKSAEAAKIQEKKEEKKERPANPEGKQGKKKEKKKDKPAPAPQVPQTPEGDFSLCHLQVSRLTNVQNHPKADKLYVAQVDVGGGEFKALVAGLKKYYSVEELEGRLVVTIRNLKPSKLMGEVSEVMVLAADDDETTKQDKVFVLQPPEGSEVGDKVFLEGTTVSSEWPARVNEKVWKRVVPLLKVSGNKACCDGKALMTTKGVVSSPLSEGSGIH
eukprot:TRINITY_DN4482_c0_g1_i1.p1 TRINITY_DN4482_c0_g1~~TRINITY_DN4482_c0_g1_i1.p1  ORF type:complete len:286 (+),score=97.63 TRINITY_DN4482_c0_g1_i1:13-870(+)